MSGLVEWIQNYEDVFKKLFLLGKRPGIIMKSISVSLCRARKILARLIQFLKYWLLLHLLWKLLISSDDMPSELINKKAARKIHNTSQSSNRSKKEKFKKVLAFINKDKIQD
jgi:hypothetical protein